MWLAQLAQGWRLPGDTAAGPRPAAPGGLPLSLALFPQLRSSLPAFPRPAFSASPEREGCVRRAVCPQEGDPPFPGAPVASVEEASTGALSSRPALGPPRCGLPP